ncbi:MAG: TIGR03986 family type III CRISPR-associated RAMP protein [Aggregatilineales bacterium]
MAHTNPSYRDREALAPYNFVPLPAKPRTARPPLSHDAFHIQEDGRPIYTGYFTCLLVTETPCFIRGPISARDLAEGRESKNNPQFFSLDGGHTPRIPGSSLRGLFRNLVEVISGARIPSLSDQAAVYRAVDTTRLGIQYRARIMEETQKNWFAPRVQAGYIRKGRDGEWYIQPAEQINGTTWCRISHRALNEAGQLAPWPPQDIRRACQADKNAQPKNARTIYIQPGPYEYQEVRGGFLHIKFARALRASATPAAGLRPAALAESGRMLSKRSEAVIFAPDLTKDGPDNGWLPLRYEDAEGNQVALDRDYRDQITDQQRALLGPNGALQDMQPVFYLLEQGRLVFFGHTFMLRIPYRHSPRDLAPGLVADGADDIDLAEAIFGYSRRNSKRQNMAFAGRVFFSDGVYLGNLPDPFEREITPQALSTPKITTFQHYLEQPHPDDKEQLQNYDDAGARIRGFKLYWHRGKVHIGEVEEIDRNKLKHATQYTRIRAVRAGAQFAFTIRFENLRAEELGALAWVLQRAAEEDYRLKLGMGKPLGMGAVKVQATLHLTDRLARYAGLFEADGWRTGAHDAQFAQQALRESIAAFETWAAGGPGQFAAQPRIRELLTLLAWPGPPRQRTRYMEIERRDSSGKKRNEYRDRPVLPAPSFVEKPRYTGDRAPQPRRAAQDDAPPAASVPRRDAPAVVVTPPKPEPLPEARETVSAEAEKLAARLSKTISEGDIVQAVVMRVTGSEYECRLSAGTTKLGKLPRDEAKGLKAGDTVRARVKRIAQSGAVILTVKGVPKE